jgi:hypothetical protein
MEAARNDPYSAFYYFDNYKDQFWAKDILREAAKNDPFIIFYYFNNKKQI